MVEVQHMKGYQISWWLYRKWVYLYKTHIYYPLWSNVCRSWYRWFMEEEELKIEPFNYNGFMGQSLPGPLRMGKYLDKTEDPGVVFVLIDGEKKRVPTFAIINQYALPKLKWGTGVMFGEASSL